MRGLIKRISIIGPALKSIYRSIFNRPKTFSNSTDYWIDRYKSGNSSGAGSYSILADFKAEILNEFVLENNIKSVIEFGCGDGNQLKLAKYPLYIGFEISPKIVTQCKKIFSFDHSKSFALMDDYAGEKVDLTLSLDVVSYLVEDDVFESYMSILFETSNEYVIIFSSNTSFTQSETAPHIKHRKFTDWVEEEWPDFKLIKHIPNRYPFMGDDATGSESDFYIYQK
jgi:hypothetical protein